MLFLRPSGAERKTWITRPKTLSVNPPNDLHFGIVNETESERNGHTKFMPAKLNPLLCQKYFDSTKVSAHRVWNINAEWVTNVFQIRLRGSSSYRNTFLTDPPCQSVGVSMVWHLNKSRGVRGTVLCEVEEPDGITIGTVIDTILHKRGPLGHWAGTKYIKIEDTTLDNVLQMLGETSKKSAVWHSGESHINLRNVVIPTDEEWVNVK